MKPGDVLQIVMISIHAPARGGDPQLLQQFKQFKAFQSTPPRGGATQCRQHLFAVAVISIHAPARGGDVKPGDVLQIVMISIHAPARGGDPQLLQQFKQFKAFQSTPPRGGAT